MLRSEAGSGGARGLDADGGDDDDLLVGGGADLLRRAHLILSFLPLGAIMTTLLFLSIGVPSFLLQPFTAGPLPLLYVVVRCLQ